MALTKQKSIDRPPQYHYFYGSTEDRSTARAGPMSPSLATDQDSLVGESLLPTDTDEDVQANASSDLPHVVLMKGNEVQPLVAAGTSRVNGSSNGSSRGPISYFKRKHPIGYIFLVVGIVSLALFITSVILFPGAATSSKGDSASRVPFTIPFPVVNRLQEGADPVSKFLRRDLIHPSLWASNERAFVFPFPTGAFWTNLVLPPTADQDLSYPIAVYPYAYKWSEKLLQVSYPAFHRKETPKEIHDYFFPDLSFGVTEELGMRYVRAFDPLSVTLRFMNAAAATSTSSNSNFWETYLVQGSPYTTLLYSGVSPVIRAFTIFKDVFCPRDDDGTIRFDAQGKDGGGARRLDQKRRRLVFGVCSSETVGSTTTLRGIQFIIQTGEGMYWFLFASEPITLLFDKMEKTSLVSSGRFSGVLRFAVLPSTDSGADADLEVSSSKALQRLIYHAGVYPVGGSVSWSFRPAATSDTIHELRTKSMVSEVLDTTTTSSTSSSSSTPSLSSLPSGSTTTTLKARIGTIRFEYKTKSLTPKSSATPSKSLLMLALPHHAESLSSSLKLTMNEFNLVYQCIKGNMTAVLGSVWSYDEVLPTLGFEGGSGSNNRKQLYDPTVLNAIIKSLGEDIKLALPTLTENIYGFGKQTARLAQLTHIAIQLQKGLNSSDVNTTLIPTDIHRELSKIEAIAASHLDEVLGNFLNCRVSDSLVYDGTLGGLVSSDGLLDSGADFGNGRYNDHHFHYGYLLYACAVLGSVNKTFLDQNSNKVDAIFYDIAQDKNMDSQLIDDIYFPAARHKLWFDGHSFASGMFPFANGKSQESSSEAVNAYYGAYLWSLVKRGFAEDPDSDTSPQTDFARLLLATEIRGARFYWHMVPSSASRLHAKTANDLHAKYTSKFSENYMVGNLGMLDVISSTWFGTDPLYVHMINFIPVTSITGELFSREYVTNEYPAIFGARTEIDMAWRGYVVCDFAIIDPNQAWQAAIDLFSPTLDSALSKSQVLYWIATRAGFDASNATSIRKAASSTPNSQSESANTALCSANPVCSNSSLGGLCCPTREGSFLDCCNK